MVWGIIGRRGSESVDVVAIYIHSSFKKMPQTPIVMQFLQENVDLQSLILLFRPINMDNLYYMRDPQSQQQNIHQHILYPSPIEILSSLLPFSLFKYSCVCRMKGTRC